MLKNTILSLGFLLTFAQAANSTSGGVPFFTGADLTPYWAETPKPQTAALTDFSGVNQANQKVSASNFSGQPTLVIFFFAQCPSLCPTMVSQLSQFQKQNGKIPVIAFSVKPETDTPEILKAFATSRRLDATQWTLITGAREEMYRVGRDMFKADGSSGPVDQAFIHTPNVYLLDSNLRIRGVFDTTSPKAMGELASDLKKLRNI